MWGQDPSWPKVGGGEGIIFILTHETFMDRQDDDHDEYYECIMLNLYTTGYERVVEPGCLLSYCIDKDSVTQAEYDQIKEQLIEHYPEYWEAIQDSNWTEKQTLWNYMRNELMNLALRRTVEAIQKDWYGFFLAEEVLSAI